MPGIARRGAAARAGRRLRPAARAEPHRHQHEARSAAGSLPTCLDRTGRTLVVEDDHSGDIATGEDVSLGRHLPDRTVHIRSYSKSHGPDLRIAAVGGSADVIDPLVSRRMLGPGWTSRLLQAVLVELLTDPAAIAAVGRARTTYAVAQPCRAGRTGPRGGREHDRRRDQRVGGGARRAGGPGHPGGARRPGVAGVALPRRGRARVGTCASPRACSTSTTSSTLQHVISALATAARAAPTLRGV